MDQSIDRNSAPPPGSFQIRLPLELGHISQTEIRKNGDRFGHPDHSLQRHMIQNTDPSDTDPLGPGGQPKILNGTARAVQVRRAYRGAAEDVRPAASPAAGYTQIDRCFFNPFELQTPVEFAFGASILGRGLGIGVAKQVLHGAFRRRIANDHEIPRLHEPNRSGMVCRRQEPHHHLVRNRSRQKISAHVAAFKNRPIDGVPF
jgi:hypothetical protein